MRIGVYTNGTYFRLLFVRHPIERILSAYRDKYQPGFFKRRLLSHEPLGADDRPLSELLKKNLDDLVKSRFLTELDTYGFNLFINYIIQRGGQHSGETGITARHYGRAYDLCRVCSIDWDFIGKMDSVENDSEKVFELLGLKDRVHLGLHPASNDHTRMVTYFKGLPKSLMMMLYKEYEADFQVLGYTIPGWLWSNLSDE